MHARPVIVALVVCGTLGAVAYRQVRAPVGSGGPEGGPAPTTTPVAATLAPFGRDDWVAVGDGVRTRCSDRPGLRLYLVDGEREPVGLLDDTCDPPG